MRVHIEMLGFRRRSARGMIDKGGRVRVDQRARQLGVGWGVLGGCSEHTGWERAGELSVTGQSES